MNYTNKWKLGNRVHLDVVCLYRNGFSIKEKMKLFFETVIVIYL